LGFSSNCVDDDDDDLDDTLDDCGTGGAGEGVRAGIGTGFRFSPNKFKVFVGRSFKLI
jgi:hypothetical protein